MKRQHQTAMGISKTSALRDNARDWLPGLAAVLGLVLFHVYNNWVFVTTQVTILGWDRPAHLARTLIYNDMLKAVNVRSIFEVMTWSWNRPPLSHLVAVPLYRLFGTSTDVALMRNAIFVAMLLFSVYGIGKRLFARKVGLLAAFIVSTYPILFSISRMPYVDYSLAAMVSLSIYLLVICEGFRRRPASLLLGLVIGLGVLIKWPSVAFAGGPVAYVAIRSGALKDVKSVVTVRADTASVIRRWWASPLFHGLVGLGLTLLWYWPNRDRLEAFALGYWLILISWLLVSTTLFALSRPAGQGANLLSAATMGASIGSVWSLPNLRFSERFLTVVYSGLNMEGTGLGPLNPSFYFRYLRYLPHEQLSPLYLVVLLLAVAVLIYSRWPRKGDRRFLADVRDSTWILVLWVGISMCIFTFSLTMNSRFDVALLPPLALISAYGLCEIISTPVRRVVVSLVVLVGLLQFFALSYDDLGWLRERAVVRVPWGGEVNLLGEGSYIELPSSGRTDARYFVGAPLLEFIEADMQGDGRDVVQLGNLVNRSYSNNAILQYLMYDAYGGIKLREFARSGWEEPPFYERLFECDYLLLKSDPNAGLREYGQQAMSIIESSPSLFEEAFAVVWEHSLPDGDTVFLYKRQRHLAGTYDAEDFRSAAVEVAALSQEGDGIVLVPGDQVDVLGRYYQGHLPAYLLPTQAALDEETVARTLTPAAIETTRLFLLLFNEGQFDPDGQVRGWLEEYGRQVGEEWYGNVHVLLFDTSAP
ncbi:MAG TPA: glycosyltransferase family 39 protein [Anaerolineae bacterium]|nr:glycosyltransferase family 39 protein [Anaerolineae bacterium]